MQKVAASLLGLCLASVFLSWITLPFYLRKVRAACPAHFRRLGGSMWISSGDALDVVTYFLKREYRECAEKSLRIHGSVLRWTLAFASVAAVALGAISFLYEAFGR